VEIKHQRFVRLDLGEDKLYPELAEFYQANSHKCPKISTIGQVIKDLGGLRVFPEKSLILGRYSL